LGSAPYSGQRGHVSSDAPTATFSYDGEGDRTAASPTTGLGSTYSYDQANQLIAYQGPDHTTNTGPGIADVFTYDADGLRQTKTTNNTLTNQAWDLADGLPLMIEDGPTAYITGPGGLPIEPIGQDGSDPPSR
jgi:hypothetical protein